MPAYQNYIARSQVAEAFTLADGLKTSIGTNRQNGTCYANAATTAGTEDKITGKYGKAEILQETKANKLNCGIKYKFEKKGVSDLIADKEITLKVDEDSGTLKMENMTGGTNTVDSKYLPSAFKKP
ncbi:fimbrial protein P9-2 precursor [Moraxella macacae 0408225]|uniref:Fimbrial protein P9-2 n=1 Tax=Moraxella macacae 0408225 TaxID=1230338 RepID=L2F9S7_9GAMM|nr:pilin [Moraxella macacae]ELA09792.1 fimbrial protein P9-2 precursor [Moraxella macacae 0408225]